MPSFSFDINNFTPAEIVSGSEVTFYFNFAPLDGQLPPSTTITFKVVGTNAFFDSAKTENQIDLVVPINIIGDTGTGQGSFDLYLADESQKQSMVTVVCGAANSPSTPSKSVPVDGTGTSNKFLSFHIKNLEGLKNDLHKTIDTAFEKHLNAYRKTAKKVLQLKPTSKDKKS